MRFLARRTSTWSRFRKLGIEGEITDVELERTVDEGGAENALYLSDDKTELISDVAFQDTFELTVKMAQTVEEEPVEKTYVIVVTDAEGDKFTASIQVFETDGITQINDPDVMGKDGKELRQGAARDRDG